MAPNSRMLNADRSASWPADSRSEYQPTRSPSVLYKFAASCFEERRASRHYKSLSLMYRLPSLCDESYLRFGTQRRESG